MKLDALVPMRHHSQRVPGRNYPPLAGNPLIQHITEMLFAVPEAGTVMVDTDSEPLMNCLCRHFLLTVLHDPFKYPPVRPAWLCPICR